MTWKKKPLWSVKFAVTFGSSGWRFEKKKWISTQRKHWEQQTFLPRSPSPKDYDRFCDRVRSRSPWRRSGSGLGDIEGNLRVPGKRPPARPPFPCACLHYKSIAIIAADVTENADQQQIFSKGVRKMVRKLEKLCTCGTLRLSYRTRRKLTPPQRWPRHQLVC